jgi:hypothetical protein
LKITNAIRWVVSGLALALLKKGMRYRLEGQNKAWLQPPRYMHPTIVNRIDFIMEQCHGKKVLHIGFTDYPYTIERIRSGTLLHTQLKKITTELYGIDNDAHAIEQYRSMTGDANVFDTDIASGYPSEALSFNPELILLSEVLEHLEDPYNAVDLLHRSFKEDTVVLVTVPNYTSLDSLAASLHRTESIHPHHCWYFSPYTLCRLFDDKRFKLHQLHFGMYYEARSKINSVLKDYPFNGDCIIAIFSIIKMEEI